MILQAYIIDLQVNWFRYSRVFGCKKKICTELNWSISGKAQSTSMCAKIIEFCCRRNLKICEWCILKFFILFIFYLFDSGMVTMAKIQMYSGLWYLPWWLCEVSFFYFLSSFIWTTIEITFSYPYQLSFELQSAFTSLNYGLSFIASFLPILSMKCFWFYLEDTW